ncbi:MAG: hypothetical protein JWL59_552 [Chthoniobacteraceae bacterium]|nr:hypothetical protein [Chthoniobacteraceae bacterium]
MCGIAGIVSHELSRESLGSIARSMRALLEHRGPDDHGEFISDNGIVALVHTRLAILDLSSAGHQPMSIHATASDTVTPRYWISFNGEIYNFRELRDELVQSGIHFHSESDTEVILRLYERDGAACVERLRGMFAFAIWDEHEQSCFLARDPLGIKPLYYHQSTNGELLFASELCALLGSERIPRTLNPAGVFSFFQTGSVSEPETLVAGIRCLPAGHRLFWRRGSMKMEPFWSFRFSADSSSSRTVAEVRGALTDSVSHHFVSDVPVGIFLSGGIDSTALLALARAAGHDDIRTFSISFDDPAFNEGDVARKTADHFGTQHNDWRLDARIGRSLFDEFLPRIDQPTIDGFNTYAVSTFARNQGMKVVLSGLGGDELFGGYPSFQRVPRMVNWSRQFNVIKPLRILGGRVLARYSRSGPGRRLGDFLQQSPTFEAAYRAYRGIYTRDEAARLTSAFTGTATQFCQPLILRKEIQPTAEDEVSVLELGSYMRNQLLRDSDVMSMACGLELRVPFVDRRLVEVLSQVPAVMRLQRGKGLLLQAVPEVPDWVAKRPKRGFSFPFEQWLAEDWKEVFKSGGECNGVRAQSWYQKWSVFMLATWCKRMKIETTYEAG